MTGNPESRVSFLTSAGVVCATLHAHGGEVRALDTRQVTLDMPQPHEFRMNLSLTMSNQPPMLEAARDESGRWQVPIHFTDTGVPHAICFADSEAEISAREHERPGWFSQFCGELRWHAAFQPRGTNANLVSLLAARAGEQPALKVRTYERGVEGETMACGTGATAAALIAARIHRLRSPVRVVVQSGDALEVCWEESASAMKNVTLRGPATFVFDGSITHFPF